MNVQSILFNNCLIQFYIFLIASCFGFKNVKSTNLQLTKIHFSLSLYYVLIENLISPVVFALGCSLFRLLFSWLFLIIHICLFDFIARTVLLRDLVVCTQKRNPIFKCESNWDLFISNYPKIRWTTLKTVWNKCINVKF